MIEWVVGFFSEMGTPGLVGWSAVGVLVVGWLTVSFSAPSARRVLLEWISASAMYVALLMLFTSLVLDARESGNTFALVAFGFLCLLFGGGLLVSLYNTATALRTPAKGAQTATN